MRSLPVTVLLFIQILSGCETGIDVIVPADPTPVVYCILDQDSTVQYLRLSRSYLAEDGTIPPGSPDSIFLARANKVAVEEVINGKVTRKAYFTPVEVTKDSGFFPAREHWVYRTDFTVKPSTDYRLVVYIEEFDRIIYSTCYTVGDFEIINPLYPVVRPIQMQTDHPLSFFWTRSQNAAIYQLGFIMHYLETRDEETLFKEIVIPLKSIFLESPDNLYSYPVNSTNFYGYLASHLAADPMVLRRYLSIDAMVISGGDELGFYMRLQEAGQTFSLMDYTNISNGIGIFSSRVIRRINGFSLTEQSIDTLAYGHLTKALNFVDRTGSRNGG